MLTVLAATSTSPTPPYKGGEIEEGVLSLKWQ